MATSQASNTNGFTNIGRSHEQPTLLPYNRKLRNLCSISLRNLAFPARSRRPRGQTIDDDADPKTFISPGRLKSLREERTLEHSHSIPDLRQDQDSAVEQDGSPRKAGGRLRPKTPRRRSTLEWVNAGAIQRQEKLEHVIEERMANVFFTLHIAALEEPIYVSETVPRTMNPDFRSIDLSPCDNGILRKNEIIIKLWAQSLGSQQWRMLSDTGLTFASLHYLGKSINLSQYGGENTILFHFIDGIYTIAATAPFRSPKGRQSRESTFRQRHTSSFDALLRLAKLTDSIEDALATRHNLAESLENMMQSNKEPLDQRDQVFEVEDRMKTIDYAKTTVTKQIDKARRQIQEKKSLLQRRRTLMADDSKAQQRALDKMQSGRAELSNLRDEHEIRKKAIASQRRRVAEDLDNIYCIRSLQSGRTLAFKIRGLPLPNAEELDSVPMSTVAAALGYTAHAVLLLSLYLNIALPYALNPMGSTSWVTDSISMLSVGQGSSPQSSPADKVYPLHLSRVARFRFDYGVFLLNKDIQLLLETGFGVRVLDIRHTLPNLKYLLYVATAGEGDLPTRKAGGVRGLMKDAREPLSRDSSSSSVTLWSGAKLAKQDSRDSNRAAQSLRSLVKGS